MESTFTKERKGEIALQIFRMRIRKEGVSTFRPNEIRRKMGNIAEELDGISRLELIQFVEEEYRMALDELFGAL